MKKLIPLAIATLLQGISIGILIPVLTHYVLKLGGDSSIAPAIFSTFSFMAFFSNAIWGRISDGIGRRNVLILSALGTTVAYIFLSTATEVWEVFASRAFAGIMAGWTVSAFAYVADVTTDNDRIKGMGLLGAFFGMGFVIGPGISSVLVSNDSYNIAGWGAMLCTVFSLLIVIFIITEPKRHKDSEPILIKNLWNAEKVRTILALAFFVSIIFTTVEGTYALYLIKKFNVKAEDIGYILMVAGLCNITMQGRVTQIIVSSLGEGFALGLAVIIQVIGLLMMIYIDIFGMYSPMIMVGIGMGLYFPTINAIASKKSPEKLKGSMSGAIQSIQSLARIIGPALGGISMIAVSLITPYIVVIILSIIPLKLAFTLRK